MYTFLQNVYFVNAPCLRSFGIVYRMRSNYSRTKLSRMEDFHNICGFYFHGHLGHQFYIAYVHFSTAFCICTRNGCFMSVLADSAMDKQYIK